jgi:hypothetical protein
VGCRVYLRDRLNVAPSQGDRKPNAKRTSPPPSSVPAFGEERGGGRVTGSALLRLQHVYRERARIGKSIAAGECRNAREQKPAADATELMLLVRGDHLVGVSARDRIVWGKGQLRRGERPVRRVLDLAQTSSEALLLSLLMLRSIVARQALTPATSRHTRSRRA